MDYHDIKKELYAYIHHASLHKGNIEDNTLLFREGIFDSMGFVALITFLQDKFDVTTTDNDLIEENFESVNAIVNFIRNKQTVLFRMN